MPQLHTSPVKCGVIGYGGAFNMGRQHLQEMKRAGMVPTAVAEIDPARLAVATTDFPGIQTYATVAEMLDRSDVELLAIITPHNTHAPLSIQCLDAGRHVVVEKPFAITTDECDAMIAAAERRGLLVSTYHNRHWDGWILRAVDQIVGQRKIGAVYRIALQMGGRSMPRDWWRSDREISGGILYDWGVHLLEYALQLLPGRKLVEVSGHAKHGYWVSKAKADAPWRLNPNEDEAALTARFDDGVWLTLNMTSLDMRHRPNFVEVVGTEGYYGLNWSGWEHAYRRDDETNVTETGKHPESQGHLLYQNVADHLMRGERLVITPQWARRMIHVIDLGVQSAKAGRALQAKYE